MSDALDWNAIIGNAKKEMEDQSREFRRTGYRAVFPAWLLRAYGMELADSIPGSVNVLLSEQVPMEVYDGPHT